MVRTCQQLLQEPDIEATVRVGDIYAVLVEYYVSVNQFEEAYHSVEQKRERGIVLAPYLDRTMIEKIYAEMGVPMANDGGEVLPQGGDDLEEELDEEIEESADDE